MAKVESKNDIIDSITDLIEKALKLRNNKIETCDSMQLFLTHLRDGNYEVAQQQLNMFRMSVPPINDEYNNLMKQADQKVLELISLGDD